MTLANGTTVSDLQGKVQAYIDGLVDSGAENGVQVGVYRHGELVVDAASGLADPESGRPVTSDTLFYGASAGKAVTATVAHVLVEGGALDYDTPVVDVWPEFGAHGKDGVTLRHVLTHSAGVPGVPADTTVDRLCDWDRMCRMIAQSEPWWRPGQRVGYHAVTFGFIVGEIVRRATGKPISRVLAEEVAGPLGVPEELYLGVPEHELGRVARLEDDPAGAAMFASLPPDFPLFKAAPRALVPNAAYGNRADVLASDIPNQGTFTARGIARMYAALLNTVDGVRLVSRDRSARVTALATAGLEDEMTGGPSTYALGYTVGWPGTSAPQDRPTLFGHVGIGVGGAFADSTTGVCVAALRNRFNPTEQAFFEHVGELALEELS